MSWFRLDSDYHADGALRRAKAVQWWPLILCAIKRGGGVASADDIAPEVLADIGQGDEAAAAAAIERLKTSGKLVESEGGWTTPGWAEFQPDPTNAERQRRSRERNKRMTAVAEQAVSDIEDRYVTVRNGDTPLRNGPPTVTNARQDRTVQDSTGQDHKAGDVVGSTSPARETTPEPPPRLREVVNAFQAASRQSGVVLPPATVTHLAELVREFDAQPVLDAIADASRADTRGGLSIAFVRRFLERSKQVITPSGGMRAAKNPAGPRDPMLTWDEVTERLEREQAEQARKAAAK